jgi:hypothetical protein
MAKGTWHSVAAGHDLLFLAEWYYGDTALWSYIYWNNLDIYGDDFEKVPVGTRVFIPDPPTKVQHGTLIGFMRKRSEFNQTLEGSPTNPTPVSFGTRGMSWYVKYDPVFAEKMLVFKYGDGSEFVTGCRGVEVAAATAGVQASTISNGYGGGAGVGAGSNPPGPAAVARLTPTPRGTIVGITNSLRLICEQYYGHAYMMFAVAAYNNVDEADVFYEGDQVKLPPIAKDSKLAVAAKWRERWKDLHGGR